MHGHPRRTPYERSDSLSRLYSLLYPDGNYAVALPHPEYRAKRNQGVSLCHVWINRGSCPHAVESTATLVQAQQLDEDILGHASNPLGEWPSRSAYAMAIVRFVNSIADALQTGLYAQSIFSIAQKIGLPIWFVELRHAATHEELPGLDVLRQASVAALEWLQTNFWLPSLHSQEQFLKTLNGSSQLRQQSSWQDPAAADAILQSALSTLRDHLSSYKKIAKQVALDASLRGPSKISISTEQNRLVSAAKKGAKSLSSLEGERKGGQEASNLICEALIERGFLVPRSKAKHDSVTPTDISRLPQSLIDTWLPLLQHLSNSLDGFGDALLDSLLDCILSEPSPVEEPNTAYLTFLAGWLLFLFGTDRPLLALQNSVYDTRSKLAQSRNEEHASDGPSHHLLSLVQQCLFTPTSTSLSVARQLCSTDSRLEERYGHVLDIANPAQGHPQTLAETAQGIMPVQIETSEALQLDNMEEEVLSMERKLASLKQGSSFGVDPDIVPPQDTLSTSLASHLKETSKTSHGNSLGSETSRKPLVDQLESETWKSRLETCALLDGWQLAETEEWQATPIGCLKGEVPQDLQVPM